ncbi:hypothetical protein SK128_025893 [Halocaridina rubra]|uniref:RING-type domain-containing protein n=1 Tax=Halocaridina rubra TaxID=373956 RepID=A0AAN9A2U3_HALRR
MDAENKACGECAQNYDDEDRIPKILPCGHTLCSKCVSDKLNENSLLCPICGSEHEANEEDFPINTEVLNMTRGEAEGETQEEAQTEGDQPEKQEQTQNVDHQEQATEEATEQDPQTQNHNFGMAHIVDGSEKVKTPKRKSRSSRKVKKSSVSSESPAPPDADLNSLAKSVHDSSNGISKKLNSMKAELSNSMESIKERSQEVTSQLLQYQKLMKQWKQEHERIIEEYLTLVHEHEDIVKFIDGEFNRVSDTIKIGEDEMKKMITAENNLKATTTAQETVPAFGEAAQRYDVVDTWTQEAQKNFPETELIKKAVMVKERSESVLQALTIAKEEGLNSITGATMRNARYQSHKGRKYSSAEYNVSINSVIRNGSSGDDSLWSPVLSVQEKVSRAMNSASASSSGSGPARSPQISQGVQAQMGPLITQIHSIRNMTPLVRQIIESGRVFAMQENKRHKRYARISFHRDHLCLHVLSKQFVPEDAFVLQHQDVINLLDPTSRLSFLTLGAGKSVLGRLYIRVAPETNRAHNFVLLCTGELGPSYANTNIIRVVDRGKNGEYVDCGDYENHNGTGGKGLVPGAGNEWGGIYKRPCLAGAVDGWWGAGDAKAAQFGITTRDDAGCSLPAAFGMVETGLHILTEAISLYRNIKEVKIVDCGIVLPS